MTPTSNVLEFLRSARDEVRRHFEAVPAGRRREAPSAGAWSAVEVLEHLASVERGIGKLVARGTTKAGPASAGGTFDVAAILARLEAVRDRSEAVEAPERVRPSGGMPEPEALAALDATRRALIESFEALDGLDGSVVSVPHAVLGPLNLYEWVVFVGAHERRHAEQLREIGERFADAVRV